MKRKLVERDAPGFFRDTPAVGEGWRRSAECAEALSATAMLFQCPACFSRGQEHVALMRRFFERIERPAARLLWGTAGQRRGSASGSSRSRFVRTSTSCMSWTRS